MSIEWAIVFATLLGPVLAVQASEWLARSRRGRQDRLTVFQTLMATRGTGFNNRHVEALNSIDIVFGSKSPSDKQIRAAWKAYLDHLNTSFKDGEAWGNARVGLLSDMLAVMATDLGFDFDRTHIKNQSYTPNRYWAVDLENDAIRAGLKSVLSGERPLPMFITNIPNPPPALLSAGGNVQPVPPTPR